MSFPCCLCASHIASYKVLGCFSAAELNSVANTLATARCPILAPSNSSGRGHPKSIVIGRKEEEISWLVYRCGCINEAKLLSSLSAKEADSTDAFTEGVRAYSCDDVIFRTWARSLTESRK